MAPTLRSNTTATSATTSYGIARPAGVADGDVLVLAQFADRGTLANMTTPTGWTQLLAVDAASATNMHGKLWVKTAAGSEPSTYGLAQGSSSDGVAHLWAIQGGTIPSTATSSTAGTGTAVTTPGITPTGSDDLEIRFAAASAGNVTGRSFAPAAGFTEPPGADAQSGGYTFAAGGYRALTSNAATSDANWTASAAPTAQARLGFTVTVASGGTSATATPLVVSATASIPSPSVSAQASATATPAVVAAVASIPTPDVTTAPIRFIDSTHAETHTGLMPAGTQQGDILLAIMQDSDAADGPAGWTQLGADRAGTQFDANAWTTTVGAGPTDLTWTNGGEGPILDILAYRGTAEPTVYAQSAAANPVAPSVTTTAPNSLLVCLYADESSQTLTAPPGMTDRTPVSGFAYNAEADQVIASPGATGTRQFGGTGNAIGAWSIILEPAAPDGDATAAPSVVTSTTAIPAPSTRAGSTAALAVVQAFATVPAPTVTAVMAASPSTVTAVAAISAPAVSAGSTASPNVVEATATIPAPTTTSGATASPAAVSATTSVPTATVTTGSTASPSVVLSTTQIPAPAISAGATVSAGAVTAAASVPNPTVATGQVAQPATVTATAAILTPAVSYGQTATPAVVAATATIPAPSVQTGSSSTATPGTVTATTSTPGPAVSAGAAAQPAVVVAEASADAPTISADSTASPDSVQASTTIPAPAMRTGATATPGAVQGSATIPAPTVQAGGNATASPATVSAAASVPSPSSTTSSTAAPTVVLATAAVPTPTTTVLVAATPAAVQAYALVPAALISTTARPPTVTAVASIPAPSVSAGESPDLPPKLGGSLIATHGLGGSRAQGQGLGGSKVSTGQLGGNLA
ncbi:hypothetical protein ABZ897_00790 [Nonomuraea sp. NPDC046802]|uniref:hypothetical protein n=1 Tax=Nonomuraea sp. NPDC046802 TaxID=3154919 RepID=UPI0034003641